MRIPLHPFSDYLHSFGNNKMLGIGYETDEDSMRLGVKLCMFDVKNPKKPKVLSSYVMKDADNTPADNNYKCVLVDQKKNMIGFMVEDIDAKCILIRFFLGKMENLKKFSQENLRRKDIWI